MATYADSVFNTEVTASSLRLPWNNTIFPGNYVAHLNAYRDQNVQAFPGVNFFRTVGVYVVPENTTTVATGDYDLEILSPDLRQDDKPRLDREMIIRGSAGGGGVSCYRTAINVVNLKGTGSSTITTSPTAVGGVTQITLADDADGKFPLGGEFTSFDGLDATQTTTDITVQATVAGANLEKVDASKEAAIIVEVCFYMNAPAPDADDVHLPYPTESGQSSQ